MSSETPTISAPRGRGRFGRPLRECAVWRYYDPQSGQFLSVDPLVDKIGEPYAYVSDDPVNGTDPAGLCAQTADRALASAFPFANIPVPATPGRKQMPAPPEVKIVQLPLSYEPHFFDANTYVVSASALVTCLNCTSIEIRVVVNGASIEIDSCNANEEKNHRSKMNPDPVPMLAMRAT